MSTPNLAKVIHATLREIARAISELDFQRNPKLSWSDLAPERKTLTSLLHAALKGGRDNDLYDRVALLILEAMVVQEMHARKFANYNHLLGRDTRG
jgi:hypothetical protein